MTFLQVAVLAIVQGLAELLPVSSSAHVVVAEKLMGLDPTAPASTLLLVMLHTGTMFAVIVYFWRRWRATYFSSMAQFKRTALQVIIATALTGIIGEGLQLLIQKLVFPGVRGAQIEDLFGHLEWIAPALAVGGILILIAGLGTGRARRMTAEHVELDTRQATIIGAVQGLSLPFRGFSRSGATISAGMLSGVAKAAAENFSFALAVVLTPVVVAREVWRLLRAEHGGGMAALHLAAAPSLAGVVLSFVAGLVALKWLSGWLENGRWYLFGIYCLIAAAAVGGLYFAGY
ncbi:MAG TPA: undecaprenyl-diphosphate phosphatase [Steroidobacteraceae bacterium]|nr:undecaprenyl-diphosphate phosphatase [Steroidobacteraceae bacterium]